MKTISGKSLSKIGIGTWGVGGRGHRNVEVFDVLEDQSYIDALTYTLEKGINFTEISPGYGHGKSLKLFKQALDKSDLEREDVFLTNSNYTVDIPDLGTFNKDITGFYKVMGTKYADSTLVTQSLLLKFGKESIYRILNDLLNSKKTRFVSLSNANTDWVKDFKEEFGDRFYAYEGFLSFEARALEDKGVISLCNELGIKTNIWRPLRKNMTASNNWPLLVELSAKYGKTQNQVILNWMCHQGYGPMVFSTNKKHIDENVSSTNFEMTTEDYESINNFRPGNYTEPSIDWEGGNIDNDFVALANGFEKNLS